MTDAPNAEYERLLSFVREVGHGRRYVTATLRGEAQRLVRDIEAAHTESERCHNPLHEWSHADGHVDGRARFRCDTCRKVAHIDGSGGSDE